LGHRIATTLSDQREVGFLYYGHGHLHQLLLDQVPLLDFERDALHRETGRQGFGGWQQRQYDLQGRLVRQYSNQPVLAWQWEYDP
ncbi:hypothetical protein PZA18_24820, partial [Chitinimonas sp. DQS-5]|nr:hypothetical protein [Parachitinimonas caeni]MDK2127264.1 hypothetical protein [Parachitinimonas caeni]